VCPIDLVNPDGNDTSHLLQQSVNLINKLINWLLLTRCFITVITKALHWILFRAKFTFVFPKINFSIVLPSVFTSPKLAPPIPFYNQHVICISFSLIYDPSSFNHQLFPFYRQLNLATHVISYKPPAVYVKHVCFTNFTQWVVTYFVPLELKSHLPVDYLLLICWVSHFLQCFLVICTGTFRLFRYVVALFFWTTDDNSVIIYTDFFLSFKVDRSLYNTVTFWTIPRL
jgi:hypothetical protein